MLSEKLRVRVGNSQLCSFPQLDVMDLEHSATVLAENNLTNGVLLPKKDQYCLCFSSNG